jgi:hypothetical protein
LKSLIFSALILLSFSCRKEVSIWDSLTEDERREIRELANAKCLSEKAKTYANFKKASNAVFGSNAAEYKGGKHGFLYQYKEGDNKALEMEIRTWKRTADEYIFYVEERPTFGNTRGYFLRIGKEVNEEMIDSLLDDHCVQNPNRRIKISGGENGPLTLTSFVKRSTTTGSDEITYTYTYDFQRLAWFSRFYVSYKLQKFDKDGKASGNAVNRTSTMAVKEFENVLNRNDLNNEFCEFKEKPYQVMATDIGYRMECSDSSSGWNL